MSGYVVNLRLRRTGVLSTTERTWAFPDGTLRLLAGRGAFVLGILLLLLAPLAMNLLTIPESARNERISYQYSIAFPSD